MKQTFVILDLRLALRALLPCALLTGLHLATPCQAALLNWQALAPLVSTMPGASAGPVGSASAPDLSALERRSGQGDTRAQAALGWHHLRPALEALASEDLAAAQHNAAQLQSAGRFAEPLRQGRYWLQRAANAGRHEAELLLGYCYLLGLGTPLQPDTGWDWVRKAADQGFGPAQYLLGSAYLSGEGLRENVFLGLFYIAQAANQGQAEAKRLQEAALHSMAEQVRATAPPGRTLEEHVRAAESGNVDVQYGLAGYYATGTLAPRSDVEALKWYQRAAGQGHLDAMLELAQRYAMGLGTEHNEALAQHWQARAAALRATQAP
jgi:uncharacterized protein